MSKYSDAIDILQAQEALVGIDVASYPSMKNEQDRARLYKHYKMRANPFMFETKNVTSGKDFARMLNGQRKINS